MIAGVFSWDAVGWWIAGILVGCAVLAVVIWIVACRSGEVDEFGHPLEGQVASGGSLPSPEAGRTDIDAEWEQYNAWRHPFEDDASRRTALEAGDE